MNNPNETPEQAEARKERARKARRELYAERKEGQKCVDCAAELQPEDGLRCAVCEEQHGDYAKKYRYSPKGLRMYRKQNQRKRKRLKKAKRCIVCRTPRDQWPARETVLKMPSRGKGSKLVCPPCMVKRIEYNARWREKRKAAAAAGIVSLRAVRDEQRKKKLRELKGLTYVPLDELLASRRVKMLRGLGRYGDEWVTGHDLLEVLGAPEGDYSRDREEKDDSTRERDAYTQMLSRFVREQLVERRKVKLFRKSEGEYEYRLAPAGRDELKKLNERIAS